MTSGPLLPVFAILAGLISISSPCVLPLLPSYLGFISSVPGGELGDEQHRRRLTRTATAFVAGFTVVFIVLGATASLLGSLLLRHLTAITQVAGVALIVLGLSSLGVLPVAFLLREKRIDMASRPLTRFRGLLVGMAFALGWTPCIGPVLASILTIAASSGSVIGGAALLAFYSLGLGLPFIALARGYGRAHSTLSWVRRHGVGIQRIGGVMMVVVGVGYITGYWATIFQPLQRWFSRTGWPPV